MDKNFRVRVMVGVAMFAVALLAMYAFNGVPFKFLFTIFVAIAMIELLSFLKRRKTFEDIILMIIEGGFLVYSILFVATLNLTDFWYIVLGVCGYDIFAYLFGKAFGGRLFPKSRPFPRISKNKTWEGTILGLTVAIGMVATVMMIKGSSTTDWIYLFCGPLALMGDLFESYLKRRFKIKDSNELLVKNSFFAKLELFVGGTEGHGGFLDRVDSVAFAMTGLLILSFLL